MPFTPLAEGLTPHTRNKGRRSKRPAITLYEAKESATRLLRAGKISPLCSQVLDALSVSGVLSNHQIRQLNPISDRTLRNYHFNHLLDRVFIPPHSLRLLSPDLTDPKGFYVYTLGAVGYQIAALKTDHQIPTGYIGFGSDRILHDLLVAETMLQLLKATPAPLRPQWSSRFEATVRDDENRPLLEPDAMLALYSGHRRQALYLVEYHNEDTARRAAAKVERYENVYRSGHWQRVYDSETMPMVLVAFTHRAVATGYQEAIAAMVPRGLRCTYLGKPLRSILKGDKPGIWQNFRTGETVDLLNVGAGDR